MSPARQEGTNLCFDYDGEGEELLIPESPTRFSWAGTIVEFSNAASGAMNILIRSVEGDERGVRRR